MKVPDQPKGQIAVFAVISILSLSMLWMMLINISKLIKNRIVMQNAVDCSAQSAACIRARGLNQAGFLNSLLGGIIICRPELAWIPYLDCYTTYKITNGISKIQTGIVKTYGGGLTYLSALEVAKAQGADMILAEPGTFSLGIKHDLHPVTFWSTIIVEGVPMPAPPTVTLSVYTWYYFKDDSAPHKNTIMAIRNAKPDFFGKGFFKKSDIPSITTIAAARPYNKKSSMFPTKDTDWGVNVVANYMKGSSGWQAQLVPVGAPLQH